MARRKGRGWGNALGGWRKQSRKANGQFGKGGGGSSKKKASKKKSRPRTKTKNRRTYANYSKAQTKKYMTISRTYRGPGSYARQRDDKALTRGAFELNAFGNQRSRATRAAIRTVGTARYASPAYLASKTSGAVHGKKGKKASKKRRVAAYAAAGGVLAVSSVGVGTARTIAMNPELRRMTGQIANHAFQQARARKQQNIIRAYHTANRAASHGISTFRPARQNRAGVYNITSATNRPRTRRR